MHFDVAMRMFELAYNGESDETIVHKLKNEFGVKYTTEEIVVITEAVRRCKPPRNPTSCVGV